MNKQQFLEQLRDCLSGLPQNEMEERLTFYSEMIDDRMEEGLSEEDAVREIGSVDKVFSNIIDEIPLTELVKEKIKPKRTLRAWEIVLLLLGAPLWFPLLIAGAAILLSIYAVIWAVVITLWAVDVAIGATSLGAVVIGVVILVQGSVLPGIAMFGSALFCAGLTIFGCFGCIAATKGIAILTKKIALGIKAMIVKKESAK
ncbi:MAG: DUF1700 domain-containing protein [Firmicutes bacterium]|nr:DUF1700 domain-containing protein [Bacillota bacterium]